MGVFGENRLRKITRQFSRTSGNERFFYVYKHVHPETKEVVYVGMGSCGRAWSIGYTNKPGYNGHRSNEHVSWYQSLEDKGHTLWDIVAEHKRNLSKEEALSEEKRLIEELSPRFNMPIGVKLLKVTEEMVNIALSLRGDGMSWSDVAKECGVSTMAIWRACNGKTKNIRG